MLQHVVVAAPARAEPLQWVGDEQACDQILGLCIHLPRVDDTVLRDLLVESKLRVGGEGRRARHHLVDQDAQAPPVHGAPVPAVPNDLHTPLCHRKKYNEHPQYLAVRGVD